MESNEMKDVNQPGSGLVGFASIALCVVGISSAIAAIIAFVDASDGSAVAGAGVLAIASALSFGSLLNALVRK
jgi:hypothetical protein